jgi:hypothetical protein
MHNSFLALGPDTACAFLSTAFEAAITTTEPIAFLAGVPKAVSGTCTDDVTAGNLYWDAAYTELAAAITVDGEIWSASVTAAAGAAGKTTVYLRVTDGAAYAYDDATCTVVVPTMVTTGDTTMSFTVSSSSQITISWGDGSSSNYTGSSQSATHTYTDGVATHGIVFSGAVTTLTTLYCHSNSLTSLNVSACTALTYLSCGVNALTSLDVSACTALTILYCDNNAWSTAQVDAFLLSLSGNIASRPTGGTCIAAGTNAAPSNPTGRGYVDTIRARPWTCTVTGY